LGEDVQIIIIKNWLALVISRQQRDVLSRYLIVKWSKSTHNIYLSWRQENKNNSSPWGLELAGWHIPTQTSIVLIFAWRYFWSRKWEEAAFITITRIKWRSILPFQRNLRSLNYKNSSRMLHINLYVTYYRSKKKKKKKKYLFFKRCLFFTKLKYNCLLKSFYTI